jgi:hypothetical protein
MVNKTPEGQEVSEKEVKLLLDENFELGDGFVYVDVDPLNPNGITTNFVSQHYDPLHGFYTDREVVWSEDDDEIEDE